MPLQSSSTSSAKESKNGLNLPRQKRLKVTRACYSCRVKKIKCDGLHPCMQCRARQRPCSFSRDGTVDSDAFDTNYRPSSDPPSAATLVKDTMDLTPNTDNAQPQEQIRQTDSLVGDRQHTDADRERYLKTMHTLEALSTMWPGEGREGQWTIDERLLYAPSMWGPEKDAMHLPHGSKDVAVQQHLIHRYLSHRYALFPVIPKRILYEQLERRGPLLTPLLIYSIYVHAAHDTDDGGENAEVYYQRATAMLNAYINTPSISTVVALCLLSLYEPSSSVVVSYSRARLYSSMAFRMCLDLGLHKRPTADNWTPATELELRKRVFWSCYCLDKMENVCRGRPWFIRGKDVDLDLPSLQPEDDAEEHNVLESFVHLIKLMQLCEKAVDIDSVWSPRTVTQTYEQEQMAIHYDNELLVWLRSLPAPLQWTPFPTHANPVSTQPPPNAMAAQLHLFYNFIQLAVLRPHSMSDTKTIHHRCSVLATNLTQLVCALSEQTQFIFSYTLTADIITFAICMHVLNCADKELSFARHSRFMFQRSLRSLCVLVQRRAIPGIERFAAMLSHLLALADNGNNLQALAPFPSKDHHGNPNSLVFEEPENATAQVYYANELTMPTTTDTTRTMSSVQPMHTVQSSHKDIQRQAIDGTHPYANRLDHDAAHDVLFGSSGEWRQDALPHKERVLFQSGHFNDTFGREGEKKDPKETTNQLFANDTKITDDATHLAALVEQLREKHQRDQDHGNNAASAWDPSTSTAEHTPLLYSMWPHEQPADSTGDHTHRNNSNPPPQHHSQPALSQSLPNPAFFQQSYMNIGLSVYASARQHHTDVIRQHFPELDAQGGPSRRPVILTQHGQVIVGNTHTTQNASQT